MNSRRLWVVGLVLAVPVLIGIGMVVGAGESSGGVLTGRKVGLVRINDVIVSSEHTVELLREFARDDMIAGVVLRLNSPGGAVAPTQEIHREIARFKACGKPIVTSMESVAASGAFYIACATDRVFANPGTITGSIGVIIRLSRFGKLLDKVGIEMESVKSGRFKDIGAPERAMSPEERAVFQALIDDTYEQFLDDASVGLGMTPDSLRPLADGRIYSGRQALSLGLVDTLGGLEEAVQFLRDTLGLAGDAKVYERKPREPFWWFLLPEEIQRVAPRMLERAVFPEGIYYLYEGG